MPTVVRLKRKRTDESQDSLVLSCKRAKQGEHLPLQTTLKLAGTLTHKDEVINLAKLKYEPSATASPTVPRRGGQKRRLTYAGTESQPAKLPTNDQSTSVLQIYDLETTEPPSDQLETADLASKTLYDDVITCNGEVMLSQLSTCELTTHENTTLNTEDDYVYDLFYLPDEELDHKWLEEALMLECNNEDYDPFSEYRTELTQFTGSDRCMAGLFDDDDNSNDEDNWRNDYPDEDFDKSSDDDTDDFNAGSKRSQIDLNFNSGFKITASDEDSSSSDDEFGRENSSFKESYKSYKQSLADFHSHDLD